MKNNAFTMVEIIFVIILLGVLAGIGTNIFPDNRLSTDTRYIVSIIKNKQKNSMMSNNHNFGDELWIPSGEDNKTTCIRFNKKWLEEQDSKSKKQYRLSSTLSGDLEKLCFDSFGRPYQKEQLLLTIKEVNVALTDKGMKTVLVYPLSGYVIIADKIN